MTSAAGTSCVLPDVVIDQKSQREYTRGKFLGKGGHAQCYEFTDKQTNVVYAGKIVSKKRLVTPRHQQNMDKEIKIHKTLRHKHVVGFHSHFEDDDYIYIILELCTRQSLVEMHRCRKALTEAEVRYFLRQLLLALEYLVQERVIHRDLKLGNLLLDEDMQLKVADFGFATRVFHQGDLKRTHCGTPNYVAPEILARTGHSYAADVWSVGCIIYALLVGHPPFKALSVNKTYARIKSNQYEVPSTVSSNASALIQWMLHPEPAKRPSIEAIMHHDFMNKGLLPAQLPVSCLTSEPHFDALGTVLEEADRKPLSEKNEGRAARRTCLVPEERFDLVGLLFTEAWPTATFDDPFIFRGYF